MRYGGIRESVTARLSAEQKDSLSTGTNEQSSNAATSETLGGTAVGVKYPIYRYLFNFFMRFPVLSRDFFFS